jgi:hypothetical protein
VLTLNNREVVIRNVVNKPVLAASSATSPGLGGTTTQTIQYLPIGTTINVLPKKLSDGTVAMTVTLQLSNIIGSEIIGGNSYPVASSRLYTAPLKVASGYTIAIAGLDEAFDSREGTGIPLLSKIPLLGYAFKNTQREGAKKTLMMFITPTVMANDAEGVGETPQTTLPIRKHDPEGAAPHFYSDGTLVGGQASLGDASIWADHRERYLRKLIGENRSNDQTPKDIALLRRVCDTLVDYIEHEKTAHPDQAERLDLQLWNMQCIRDRASTLGAVNWRHKYWSFLGY